MLITNGTQFNHKETSWGILGPAVPYKKYHCISVRTRFPLKLYAFLENIDLHNILCETNWIVIRAQFYRLFCEKDTKDRNGPFRSVAVLVLNSNDMTSLSARALNTDSTVSRLHSSSGRKGYSLQVYTGWMTEIQLKSAGSSLSFSKVLPEGKSISFC